MSRKIIDIRSSLTARIFLMTVIILLISSSVTYLFLAWATPISFRSVVTDNLNAKLDRLIEELQNTTFENSGPLIARFEEETGTEIELTEEQGDTGSLKEDMAGGTVVTADAEAQAEAAESVTVTADFDSVSSDKSDSAEVLSAASSIAIASSDWDAVFRFKGSGKEYRLTMSVNVSAVNQTSEAMRRVQPYLILVMFVLSLLGALFYSLYITRPIVGLTGISRKMAALDFNWRCPDTRKDEIGVLSRNLNELSDRLQAALSELKEANASLQRDIDREREMERRRSAFFAAASHELKTPITVLKGQISGMLAGVDIYRDRDKYLARSLAVTGRMEKLIQEMLTISRMEQDGSLIRRDRVNLAELIQEQIGLAEDLAQLKEQELCLSLTPEAVIQGDRVLLSRVVSNLMANALHYSPEAALVSVRLFADENGAVLEIENSGVHIPEDSLPRLFEPFYRVETSRSRETGGSGLGLYLVKMILERHDASCGIENTESGVQVTVRFNGDGAIQ